MYDTVLDKCTDVSGPYVFLRSDCVNGRRGPSKDYPCVYVYHRRGLPMAIVEQQSDWFLLKDWQGGQSWVHRSLCSRRRRYVLIITQDVAVYTQADTASHKCAYLQKGVCVELLRYKGNWLRVAVAKEGKRLCTGWISRECAWGS